MNELTDKLLAYLNSAEMFLKEQAPDFVQQFIAYEAWHAHVALYGWLTITIILFVTQLFIVAMLVYDKFDLDLFLPVFFSVGGVGTMFFIASIDSYMDVKKLEMAPKVYMVERAVKLTSSKCK